MKTLDFSAAKQKLISDAKLAGLLVSVDSE
jgi:hypothetical protein